MSVRPDFRAVLLLALALIGCGKSDEGKQPVAAGEVLPGSASDAMLPLDTLRSQPPLAPPVEASRAARERKGEAGAEAGPSDAASAAASESAPSDGASEVAETAPE